ncbi:MAG: hypothetical protein AAFU77_08485 [Myxococcota bacterium]
MKRIVLVASSLVAVAAFVGLHAPAEVEALPMYAMRSARTCGNCHLSPTYEDPDGWDNPELAYRKCNMSCMACHVNPTGGGMRAVGGRYYGQSTLSMYTLQERSYSDTGRELFSAKTLNAIRKSYHEDGYVGPGGEGKFIPSDYEEVLAGVGQGQTGGWTAFGKPSSTPSRMSFWDGRYGDLNADPAFSFGGDLRGAFFSYEDGTNVFPMQMDIHGAIQPVDYITAYVTAAGQGRTSGIDAVVNQPDPVYLRNAFLMVHELPYMAYAKAGIFQPSFGTYIDDHTSFTREYFELDVSTPDSTVYGVEVGAAPNYPFISASVFGNRVPQAVELDDVNGGWGAALNLGWRDIGWWASGHAMIKRRDLEARGDLDAAGVAWGFNPFNFSNSIPLTYLGEVSFGRREGPVADSNTQFVAMYHELWYTLFNGVSLRAKYDFGDVDLELGQSNQHRFSGGFDVSPWPGITVIGLVRHSINDDREDSSDLFIHTHVWF